MAQAFHAMELLAGSFHYEEDLGLVLGGKHVYKGSERGKYSAPPHATSGGTHG